MPYLPVPEDRIGELMSSRYSSFESCPVPEHLIGSRRGAVGCSKITFASRLAFFVQREASARDLEVEALRQEKQRLAESEERLLKATGILIFLLFVLLNLCFVANACKCCSVFCRGVQG